MINLRQLVPINYTTEKAKFFVNQSYNPQFIFESSLNPQSLPKYEHINDEHLAKAHEIVDRAYFNRTPLEIAQSGGKQITQSLVTSLVHDFLHAHQLQEEYMLLWSTSDVSRASVNHKNKTITLKRTAEFRQGNTMGLIFHEIGTHILRQVNYEKQPWFRKREENGFSDYLTTEEGLATLHTLLPQNEKSAHNAAIRYIAVKYAQSHTFAELWSMLTSYVYEPELRWMITFRQKRGLSDTSGPGGFMKDTVYFSGAIQMAKWLEQHQYDLKSLYFGKLSSSDVQRAVELNPEFTPQLPNFFTENAGHYAQEMHSIAQYNEFLD